MSRRRGTTLMMTLAVAAIVVVVAFALVSLSLFNLNVANRNNSAEIARSLAETTLAIATDQLLTAVNGGHQDYGTHNETVHFQYPDSPQDGTGDVSFNQGQTAIPYSLNNLASFAPTAGSTHRVTGNTVYLVAVGQSGSETRTAEAAVYFPRYLYGLAAGSTVHSLGGLLVGAIPQGSGTVASYDPSKLLPANVCSNSTDAQAIVLGSGSHVTGDAQAVGGINSTGAQVDGQIKAHNAQVPLPPIDATTFDTISRPGVQILASSSMTTLPLSGFARRGGDLDVSGDVQLNRGVLYVAGNLHVHGAVTGLGALVTTGTLQIDGATTLSTDNQVAIISNGDVTLTGTGGQAASAIQGLVYTQGRLYAHDMTLVGVFVANGINGGVGQMQVDNVNLVQSPDMGRLDFSVSFVVPPQFKTNQMKVVFNPAAADLTAASAYLTSVNYPTVPLDFSTPTSSGPTLVEMLKPTFYVDTNNPGTVFGGGGGPNPPQWLGPMTEAQLLQYMTALNLWTMGQNTTYLDNDVYANVGTSAANQIPTWDPVLDNFSIDVDQFLNPSDTTRVLYWRVY